MIVLFWNVGVVVSKFTKPNVRFCEIGRHFIIADKPYDLKINSNDERETTLQTVLKSNYPKCASRKLRHEFYFVQRLDYATSGVICIPKHLMACQLAAKALQFRKCKKYYIALVRGLLSSNLIDLREPVEDTTKGHKREARTVILVLEEGLFDNYPTTKVLIRPITGRRHQIRIHCSSLGHTIVGDYTYSNRKDVAPFRMFLHSFRLILPNELENIDFQTVDPFVEGKIGCWKPAFRRNEIFKAYELIDEYVFHNSHAKDSCRNKNANTQVII